MIKVFGHISPDTDATGSAILFAWYLNNVTSQKASPFVLGEINKETQFVLGRWNIPEPEILQSINAEDEVAIVDTNNPQELFSNINDAVIKYIIDHHRLAGGLTTKGPLEIIVKPFATTASIIHHLSASSLSWGVVVGERNARVSDKTHERINPFISFGIISALLPER